MSFDQSTITSLFCSTEMGALNIDWTTTSPPRTWWQIYVNGQLAWRGQTTSASIPAPSTNSRIDVGAVDSSDSMVRFTENLPASPKNRALLKWTGGMFQDELGVVAGFYVYSATGQSGFGLGGFGAGGLGSGGGFGSGGFGVGGFGGDAYTLGATPLANLPAYTNGITTTGFGMGGFGSGGFGSASGSYSWTSAPLTGGIWSFAVAAYDTAGNVGTPALVSVTIVAPPAPPALFSDGERIHYLVAGFGAGFLGDGGFGESCIELFWNPSPSGV
jgi:hypothetical protein